MYHNLKIANRAATSSASESMRRVFAPKEAHMCILCDQAHSSWKTHSSLPSHIARVAICSAFAMPERCENVMSQLRKHIQLDFNAVDELTHVKQERRKGRLRSTLQHLAEKNTLCFSLPYLRPHHDTEEGNRSVDDSTHSHETRKEKEESNHYNNISDMMNVSDKFVNFVFVGSSYVRREVLDRVARLMPNASTIELSAIARFILLQRNLSRMFDVFDFAAMIMLKQRKLYEANIEKIKCGECTSETKLNGDSSVETEISTAKKDSRTSIVTNSENKDENNNYENDNIKEEMNKMESITKAGTQSKVNCHEGDSGSENSLESIKETLEVLTNNFPPLHMREKAAIVLSVIGELYIFHQADKSRSVADKAAAEALVQNVLAAHSIENLMSELIHEILQKVVDEGIPVWRAFQAEQKERGREDDVPQLLTLHDHPLPQDNKDSNNSSNNTDNIESASALATHIFENREQMRKMNRQLKAFLPLDACSVGKYENETVSVDTKDNNTANTNADEQVDQNSQRVGEKKIERLKMAVAGVPSKHVRIDWSEVHQMLNMQLEEGDPLIYEKSIPLTPRFVRKEGFNERW